MSNRYKAANIIGAKTVLITQSSQDILHIRGPKDISATNVGLRNAEMIVVSFTPIFLAYNY